MSIDNAIPAAAKVAGTIIMYRQAHAGGTTQTDVYELSVPGDGGLIPGTLRVRTDLLTGTLLLAGLFADFAASCSALRALPDLSENRVGGDWKRFAEQYQHHFYALGGDFRLCAVELDGWAIDPEGRWDFQRPTEIPVLPGRYWPAHRPPDGWGTQADGSPDSLPA